MTGTQFICNVCNEIIDTYEDHEKMMQHMSEHEEACKKLYQPETTEQKRSDAIFETHFPKKMPIEELKNFIEYSIRNDDECIDFLHNSRHKRNEEWYEKWATGKVRGYLGAALYSPVCKTLGDKAGMEIIGKEFDKLFTQVVIEIVNGIW